MTSKDRDHLAAVLALGTGRPSSFPAPSSAPLVRSRVLVECVDRAALLGP